MSTTPVTEEKDHSPFGPSSSDRYLACPGSVQLSEKMPPKPDNVYSIAGVKTHECLEAIVKAPDKRLATEARLLKKYDKEMVENASWAADELFKRHRAIQGAKLYSEQKVDISSFTRPNEFGTLDAAIVEEFGMLEIADYKNGFVPVEVERNSQLIAYALGVAIKHDFNFSKVRLTILQPNAAHDDGPIRSWDISIRELHEWAAKFKAGVKRALGPNPPLVSGSHCKYCAAISICPKVSKEAMEEAQIYFDPVLDTVDMPAVKGLDNDTIGGILRHADTIESWLGEIRSIAYTKLDNGEDVPGFKLVDKRATRKWINAEKVATEAKKVFGDIAFKRDLKSPAQLEELAADAKPWVAKRCALVSSGYTLARVEDKRRTKPNIALEFKPVKDGKGESMATKKKAAKKKTAKKSTKKSK